jgi:hypothetical protein
MLKTDAKRNNSAHLDRDLDLSFKAAAELSGLDLFAWIRERLKSQARREPEGAGRKVAFLK